MGWDETSRGTYPCNCGKGTYTFIIEMDDWNRYREHRTMNCPVCAEKEKREENNKIEESKLLFKLAEEIRVYFSKKYMDQLFTYFSTAKNKKQTWELAKEIGIERSSISSFYKHFKNIEKYIEDLANYQNMSNIMKALNIEDVGLNSKVEKAMELYEKDYARAVSAWHKKR